MYDELIKWLWECASGECFNCSQYTPTTNASICQKELMKQAADAIEQLRGLCASQSKDCSEAVAKYLELWAKQPRWISVTERLPEPKQKVLVATYHGGVYYGYMEPRGEFYTANNTLADSWCWEPNVTHWMPLPQPPEEGE